MDLTQLVLQDDARIAGCGRVVSVGEETWFDPPLPTHLVYYAPGSEPAPRPSGLGVRVEGVDLDQLEDRHEKDGALEGLTCLTGTWRSGTLHVTSQRPWSDRPPEVPSPSWETPPCPPPPDGWPLGELEASVDLDEHQLGPEAVNVTLFHPSESQVVVVIASQDPDATRQRLIPALGDRLCVIPSPWTRLQVRQVRGELDARFHEWGFLSLGETADKRGHLLLVGQVRWVTPVLADFAAGVPEGLLRLDPWLRPSSATSGAGC